MPRSTVSNTKSQVSSLNFTLVIIALSSIIALAAVLPILPLVKGVGGILGQNTDRTPPVGPRPVVSHPDAHSGREIGIRPTGRMTHAEFVSIIFPAFGLDSRTLKTATVEDRIDVLESLDLAPADGYQPDKTLTVKEASVVLTEVATRVRGSVVLETTEPKYVEPGQSSPSFERSGFAFSEGDEQPVLPRELAAAIQSSTTQKSTVEFEMETTTTVTVETQAALDLSFQIDRIEELKRILEERLVEYYNPPYTQPLSPTD